MKLSFIGAGNLSWHLAIAFDNAGHPIQEVYSRDVQNAQQLISMLFEAQLNPNLNFADSLAEVFVLAVPDDAIEEVITQLVLPEKAILVHTSGSIPLERLQQLTAIYSDVPIRTGVFYPLQTFTKGGNAVDFDEIPVCIEASDRETEALLVQLGQELSKIVYLVSSQERKVLHIAAVFACNFTNQLLAIAKDIMDAENLEFELLKPLIEETFFKALAAPHPAVVQTGPARRGDLNTLNLHLDYLSDKPELLPIYQLLTDSIQGRYVSAYGQSKGA